MMKKLLVGCAVAIVAIAAFVYIMFRYGEAEFKPLIVATLDGYNALDFDRIYAEAADELHQQVTQDQFKQTLGALQGVLGKFVEAGSITGVSRSSDMQKSVASVSLNLKFEKAETTGNFSFIKNADQWKLEGLKIDIPENLRKQMGQAPSQPDATQPEAPQPEAPAPTAAPQ
jgi:hypothetical protein